MYQCGIILQEMRKQLIIEASALGIWNSELCSVKLSSLPFEILKWIECNPNIDTYLKCQFSLNKSNSILVQFSIFTYCLSLYLSFCPLKWLLFRLSLSHNPIRPQFIISYSSLWSMTMIWILCFKKWPWVSRPRWVLRIYVAKLSQ